MKRKTSRKKRQDPETAGIEYATAQLESGYFMDWVRDQLAEASRMDPNDVLPLETKSDARVVAKNMLQQLEWDTMREIDVPYEFAGGGSPGTEKAFLSGVRRGYSNPSTVDWLADEILEIKREMGARRPKAVRSTPGARRPIPPTSKLAR